MGLIASSLCCIGEAACCAGSACCCFARCFRCRQSYATRAIYGLMFVLTLITGWVLNTEKIRQSLTHAASGVGFDCPTSDAACFGTVAVYKVMAGMAIYHAILAIAMIGVTSTRDKRAVIHNGCWLLKALLWIGIIIACFFIDGRSIANFYIPALIGAIVFMLAEMLLLVDLAHSWNEDWVAKAEDTQERRWFCGLITAMLFFYSVAMGLTITLYIPTSKECKAHTFFVTFNMIIALIVSFLSVHPSIQERNPHSGLLQSSIVAAYATYLVWSGILSAPFGNLHCPGKLDNAEAQNLSLWMGVILLLIVVSHSALGGANEPQNVVTGASNETPLLQRDTERGDMDEYNDEADATKYSYFWFHVTYAGAAMYSALLLTGFVHPTVHNQLVTLGSDDASLWVQMVSSWLVWLLYLWTVIAPAVLPDRDFS